MNKIFLIMSISLLCIGCTTKKYLIINKQQTKHTLMYPYSCKFISEEEYNVNKRSGSFK